MKINHGIIFAAACFLCGNAFASLEGERDKYKTMYVPYNNAIPVANVPRDSTETDYDPIEVCGKPADLTVTGLRMKYEYYWQRKREVAGSFFG